MPGGGGVDDEGGLGGLPGAGAGADPAPRTGGDCDGQPFGSQGRQGARDTGGSGLRSVLYLSPYSPDLNPIEQAFRKVKGLLRRAEARTREALVEAMGQALSAVTTQDAAGFLDHCGYRDQAQLL